MSAKVTTSTLMRTNFGTKANYCQGKYWFQLLELPPYGDIYYTLLGEGNIRRRFMTVIFGPWRKKGNSGNVEEGSKGIATLNSNFSDWKAGKRIGYADGKCWLM